MVWREALVLLVSVAAVAGCSGQRGAGSPAPSIRSTPDASGAARSEPATPTALRRADPWADGVTEKERVAGTCSLSAFTGRADVYRCFVTGNRIADPCFANASQTLLACPMGARVAGDSLVVAPSTPLESPPPSTEPPAPLLLELANGDRCTPQGGTSPEHAGVYFDYGCDHGDATSPVDQDGVWTVAYFESGTGAQRLVNVSVLYE